MYNEEFIEKLGPTFYKIDLTNWVEREVQSYSLFKSDTLTPSQLMNINDELEVFKNSLSSPWEDMWDVSDLRFRLRTNWWFFYMEGKGWSFVDLNKEPIFICNRYTSPNFRKQGVGSDLMWMRLNELKKHGYFECVVHISDWNTSALSVFKDKMFKKITKIYL